MRSNKPEMKRLRNKHILSIFSILNKLEEIQIPKNFREIFADNDIAIMIKRELNDERIHTEHHE